LADAGIFVNAVEKARIITFSASAVELDRSIRSFGKLKEQDGLQSSCQSEER
jgi:hypothetical protein